MILFKNGRIITPDGTVEGLNLLYNSGRVEQLARDISEKGRRVVDLKGKLIAPGLSELHIHGCSRWGFEDIDLDGFRKAAEFLMGLGITTIIPTFQWDSKAVANAAGIIKAYIHEGGRMNIPGIYIEGPFINPEKKGGISQSALAPPSIDLMNEITKTGNGLIRIMTIAPELPGVDAVLELLIKNNILPAFGHSDCSLSEAENLYDFCISRGVRPGMTHLCNASSPMSHRNPGLAMLPFTRDTYFELNADGVHIDDSMLKLINLAASENRLLLISDALISAGLQPDMQVEEHFTYYGKEIVPTSRGVRSKNEDILSGSASLIPDVICHYSEITGLSIEKTVGTFTHNASGFLGLNSGTITNGSLTDLAVFNEKLELQELFLKGQN